MAAGFAGVILLLRPDPATLGAATLMPLAAGALYGLANLLTREWCADEPVGALLASYFAALGIIGAAGSLVLALHPAAGAPTFLTAPWAMPSAVGARLDRRPGLRLARRGRAGHPRLPAGGDDHARGLRIRLPDQRQPLGLAALRRAPRLAGAAGIALIVASGFIVAGTPLRARAPTPGRSAP